MQGQGSQLGYAHSGSTQVMRAPNIEPQQEPPMSRSVGRAIQNTSDLHASLDALTQRLSGYLHPAPPDASDKTLKEAVPPMIERVDEVATSVYRAAQRVNDLLSRLAI